MESKRDYKLLILAGSGVSSSIVFHGLSENFNIAKVIQEASPSKSKILKKRVARLGWTTVVGQVLFMLYVKYILNPLTNRRKQSILHHFGLNDSNIPASILCSVNNINDLRVVKIIEKIQPDLILVNGTRIIKKKILYQIKVPIINMHAGITPQYRGVHGGYWALVNHDSQNCGVTIHKVDAGIDTGSVIAQARIYPTKRDNFTTYPILQLAAGLDLLVEFIPKVIQRRCLNLDRTNLRSQLYYHPTFWFYIYHRWRYGIK